MSSSIHISDGYRFWRSVRENLHCVRNSNRTQREKEWERLWIMQRVKDDRIYRELLDFIQILWAFFYLNPRPQFAETLVWLPTTLARLFFLPVLNYRLVYYMETNDSILKFEIIILLQFGNLLSLYCKRMTISILYWGSLLERVLVALHFKKIMSFSSLHL